MGESTSSRLNACLADYHRRVSLGEKVDPERYRDDLGELFPEFESCLSEGARIDDARNPPEAQALPRPFGQFTLLRELGRGATGVVYEAVQRHLGRRVALKVLRVGFDTHATARERFRREARACAQVQHDHIVEIFEAGIEEDRPYYAMTLLQGKSLTDVIADGEVPELPILCRELAQVADALQAMHDLGIVHRDIKPSNIMVEPDGRMVLADFGLARTADAASLTQTGDALGTPLYMSPEQMLGKRKEIDGRTDVYGLGATLYECITGQPPFQTKELPSLLRMVLTERPVSPRKVRADVPKELDRIVLKCLEKRADDRYASAEEVRRDLIAFAEGGEVKARPVSLARHEARRMLSTPRRIAVAALLLVLVGALVVTLSLGPDTAIDVAPRPDTAVAMVSLNDGAPVPEGVIDVEPGHYHVRVTAAGFLPYEDEFDVPEGQTYRLAPPLAPADWRTDKDALEKFLGEVGVSTTPVKDSSSERSGAKGNATDPVLVFPRGLVRPEDLGRRQLADAPGKSAPRFEIEVPEMYEGDAQVHFAVDGEDVASVSFPEPDIARTVLPLPEAVLERLKPGTRIDWRVEQGGKVVAKTSFQLVDPNDSAMVKLAADLARVEKALHGSGDPTLMAQTAMHLYLDAGLHQAALAELEALAGSGSSPSLRAYELAKLALLRSFGEGRADQERAMRTQLWTHLVKVTDTTGNWDEDEKAAAYDGD